MSVREVTTAEFYQLSQRSEGKLLVTQFTATWCGPCRRVAPQFDALARRMPEVEFVKVYEHNSREAIIASGVRSFPTFHFYLAGAKIDECRGANIAQVELKANQHKAAASAAGGPVMVKLRYAREKLRESGQGFILVAQETEMEVHASEGLEIFKFQVLSLTDIEADEQDLTTGDSNAPIVSDADLTAALRRTGGGVYGNYPVIRVSKRAAGTRGGEPRGGGESAGTAETKGVPGGVPLDWEGCCSRTYFGTRPVIQPAWVIREESVLPEGYLSNLQKKQAGPEAIFIVCKACAENCFVPGRAEPCASISTSAAFVCQSKEACRKGYGSDLFSGRADAGTEVFPPGSLSSVAAESAAARAAEAVYYVSRGMPETRGIDNTEMARMRQRISSGMSGVLEYEDSALLAKARAVLPPDGTDESIVQKGAEIAAVGGFSEEEGLARALMSWFKKDFFKWTNKPACSACGARGASIQGKGGSAPTPEEASAKASRVELYACTKCGAWTRFPRYNDPAKLLETRNGRCGEWANCFTLLCRAVGLEARWALDFTDHVWTEVWIPAKNAWIHADPCENKLDKPLMYEQGWNKRLSYVLAFDKDGAVDVTRRYTRRWLQVLSRRNTVPEKWLADVLASCSVTRNETIVARLAQEQRQLKECESMRCDGDGLDREEKEGRQSGDAEWIASRGEGGVASTSATGAGQEASSKSRAASPLVGVPLGVLQPGGGLTLCVAAVVERSGDASVVVGGATVCQLSGRGREALCAAAVSAATGILLDTRKFVLGGEKDSPAMAAWLAELPNGAVVAVAAGGASKKQTSLDAGLAAEMATLVGDGGQDTDDGKSTPQEDASTLFALVGWKGTGPRKWARRKHLGVGHDGGRCALYAELLLPPALLAADRVAKPTQIELQDKISLCPLRSLSGESVASTATSAFSAPARGMCRRAGEPAVLVGPGVDLADCPGWTTVLQVPEDMAAATADGVDKGVSPPPAAWMVTTVCPAVGGTHDDTEEFDDGAFGCPAFVMGGSSSVMPVDDAPFLPVGRVRAIVGWSGDSVNGVQVVYDVHGDVVRGPKRMGDHGLYRQTCIVLDIEGGEVLTEISVKAGALVDSLHVRTSKGREQTWGGDGGHLHQTWHIPAGSSFLGFHGGVGGHLHSLGVTLAEKNGQVVGQGGVSDGSSLAVNPVLSPVVKTNLYSADQVTRACAQFLAFNATPPAAAGKGEPGPDGHVVDISAVASRVPPNASLPSEEVVIALETLRKYADNLLANPLDPKVSRIRLANGFFDRKIGRLPGGGGVLRAMGFELADEGGRMHYVFRREGAGGGLEGLRRARQTIIALVATLKTPAA